MVKVVVKSNGQIIIADNIREANRLASIILDTASKDSLDSRLEMLDIDLRIKS